MFLGLRVENLGVDSVCKIYNGVEEWDRRRSQGGVAMSAQL